jgi:hypothetical protein
VKFRRMGRKSRIRFQTIESKLDHPLNYRIPIENLNEFINASGLTAEHWDSEMIEEIHLNISALLSYLLENAEIESSLMRVGRLRSEFAVRSYFWRGHTELNKDLNRTSFKSAASHFLHSWTLSKGLAQLSVDVTKRCLRFDRTVRNNEPIFSSLRPMIDALVSQRSHKRKLIANLMLLHKTEFALLNLASPNRYISSLYDESLYLKTLPPSFSAIKMEEDSLRREFVKPDFNFRKLENSSKSPDNILLDFWKTESVLKQDTRIFHSELTEVYGGTEQFIRDGDPVYFRLVDNKESFIASFLKLTAGIFDGFNWNNVMIAGGSVLSCLINQVVVSPRKRRRRMFRDEKDIKDIFYGTDIDIFIYGIDNEEEANAKIASIVEFLSAKKQKIIGKLNEGDMLISAHSITLLGIPPFPHIQFILRLYR